MKIQRGFTLVEVSVATSIVIILLGFIVINLTHSQQTASLTSIEEILVTDLRQQQLKAMVGDTEGRVTSGSYEIHFTSDQYILFHGSIYSSSDTSNSAINLDDNMQFNNPNYDIVFSKLSGTTSATIIELQDNTNSKLKRIHLNVLGVVIMVESL